MIFNKIRDSGSFKVVLLPNLDINENYVLFFTV